MVKSIIVKLNEPEMYRAVMEGVRRRLQSIAEGYANAGRSGKPWQNDIDGACAEAAVCKWMDVYWHGTGKGQTDIGEDIEVRHTVYKEGHLLVREKDDGDSRFILVVGQGPEFSLRGWILGSKAKNRKHTRDNEGGVYWVPQSALKSMEELKL